MTVRARGAIGWQGKVQSRPVRITATPPGYRRAFLFPGEPWNYR
jgi:hypothetical protein